MKKLIALFLVLLFAIGLTACGSTPDSDKTDSDKNNENEAIAENKVDWFISEYNSIAPTPITDIAEVDVTDKESGHYRTEFRTTSFAEATAKTGKIGDTQIDIVAYGYSTETSSYSNENIRIYAYGITIEQAKEIIKYASPILDNDLTDADIEEVLLKVDESPDINGYYYGKIGLTLIRSELMLKFE